MTQPNSEWIWMHNGETGGTARFPIGAREGWEARGWVEVEAPPSDDGTGTPIGVQDDPQEQEAPAGDLPDEKTDEKPKASRAKQKSEVTDNG